MSVNIFDVQEHIIELVKSDSSLWNDDPVERAKPDYTGFRSIVDNFVTDKWSKTDFPALVIEVEETSLEEYASSSDEIEYTFSFASMCLTEQNSPTAYRRNAYEKIKKSLDLLNSYKPKSPIAHTETIVCSYKVSASSVIITVSVNTPTGD